MAIFFFSFLFLPKFGSGLRGNAVDSQTGASLPPSLPPSLPLSLPPPAHNLFIMQRRRRLVHHVRTDWRYVSPVGRFPSGLSLPPHLTNWPTHHQNQPSTFTQKKRLFIGEGGGGGGRDQKANTHTHTKRCLSLFCALMPTWPLRPGGTPIRVSAPTRGKEASTGCFPYPTKMAQYRVFPKEEKSLLVPHFFVHF